MIRAGLLVALAALVSGCGRAGDPPAPGHASPPGVPSLIDIAETPGRPVPNDIDMRMLEPSTGDLDAVIERGVVRVLVVPGRTHFALADGMQRGRTVDAAVAFERFVNQRIAPRRITVALIPSSETSLIPDLLSGQADIAANVLRTFERDDQVAFANPVRTGVREIVVTGPGAPPLVSLEDVGGRAIHVRKNSDHHASLARLNDQLKRIDRPAATIVVAPDAQTDEDLLELVNGGRVPATLVDDYVYDKWRASFDRIAANRDVAVSQGGEIAWVTRKDSPRLLALVNEFFSTRRLTF
jgi:membrane-bound lytic murein transglycosylase MltF